VRVHHDGGHDSTARAVMLEAASALQELVNQPVLKVAGEEMSLELVL